MAYVIRHNNPSTGYISWQNLNMQYNGVSYAIADGYTDKIYTWWEIANPYVLQSSNTFPTLTAADALVLLNKNGTATLVPGATILDGALIVPGTIMADALSANSVTGEKILAGEIDTTHLAAGAVTASTVAADAIGAAAIAAGAIQTDHLSADAITTDKIVAGAITAAKIAAETILANNIAANAITGDRIAANAITSVKIAADAVTAEKINVNELSAISSNIGHITAGSIGVGVDLPVAQMGVDSNCTALFHFDGSLNSHKGLTPTFTRASVAYLEDGTKVETGQPRFEPGKFGRGVLVEEGTTNLLADGSFETGTAGFGGYDQSTVTRSTEQAFDGAYSLKVVAGTGANGIVKGNFDANTVKGKTITFSIWVKAVGSAIGKTIFGHIYDEVIYGVNGTTITLDGTWQRISVTHTLPASITYFNVYALSTDLAINDVVYFDCAQIEEKAYPTSWITSDTTRITEKISLSTTNLLDYAEGTISFWWTPLNQPTSKMIGQWSSPPIIQVGNYAQANSWLLWVIGGQLRLYWGAGANDYATITNNPDWYKLGVPVHFVVRWTEGKTFHVFINGTKYGPFVCQTTLTGIYGNIMALGNYDVAGGGTNATYDELRIDKVARTDDEIASWYKANAPFYSSEDMRQLPGYVRVESDGIKVYDSAGVIRVIIGSWLRELIRRYGVKIIEGELWTSFFSTRAEGDTTSAGIEIDPNGVITIYDNLGDIGMMIHGSAGQGRIDWYLSNTQYASAFINAGGNRDLMFWTLEPNSGFSFSTKNGVSFDIGSGGTKEIKTSGVDSINLVSTSTIRLSATNAIFLSGDTTVIGSLNVSGSPKNAVENTIYGDLAISAVECPEVRYVYPDVGILTNGECRVDIDPMFLACIEPNTEHSKWVFDVTPHGKAMLYIDEIGEDYFVVKDYHEVADGVEFSWTLSAVRKDFAHRKFMEVIPKNVVESRIARRTPEGQ